jgi:hypothetical protein
VVDDDDEKDMDELIMRMKDLLDSKLKIAKIQYGTHLVDPTPDDI